MAILTHICPQSPGCSFWPWEFLKEELAPYPGRAAVVARMVIAATIVMLITIVAAMTMRATTAALPGYGARSSLRNSQGQNEQPGDCGQMWVRMAILTDVD